MRSKTRKRKKYWGEILVTVMLLCGIGIIMVYSASSYQCSVSAKYGYDSFYYLKRQIVYVMAGFTACIFIPFVNYRLLNRWAKVVYLASIVSIFLLLTPLGVSVNGATRWLRVGGFQFQVAEVVKIGVIIFLGYMVENYYKHLNNWRLVLYMWIAGGGAAILLWRISNDLSSAIVVLAITFMITLVFTDTLRLHAIVAVSAVFLLVAYVCYIRRHLPSPDEIDHVSFRVGRIAAWLKPELYETDISYQSFQALYAIGRGGIWGRGLGESMQKLNALPEAQNDMIFAVLCEELGAFGAILMIVLYLYLFWLIVQVARKAKEIFGSVLATGCLIHLSIQAMINIAVNLSVIPNTGIGLPFISYGGTAVLCQLVEIAFILSVERGERII